MQFLIGNAGNSMFLNQIDQAFFGGGTVLHHFENVLDLGQGDGAARLFRLRRLAGSLTI
jgi:hypothetical protein